MNYISLSIIKASIIYEKKRLNTDENLDIIGEIIWIVDFIPACNLVISIINYRRKIKNIIIYLLLKICTKIIMK